jgi:hypothetical protein
MISVSGIQKSPIFELNFEQIKHLLRTKTAIGSTLSTWGDDRNITIELTYTDVNGKTYTDKDLPFRYQLPYEELPESVVDYDDFIIYASNPQRTDHDKRNYLRHKIVIKKGTFQHNNNREIHYAACFVPKRSTWDTLSIAAELTTEEQLADDTWKAQYDYILYSSGIYTSVKGMPTGITIDPPSTGYAGYWSNLFIILEDSQLSFDIGRKSLPGRQTGMIREYAKDVFNDYLRIIKYISGEAEIVQDWDKQELLDEIDTIPDLHYADVKMMKTPKDQEASVAAIFYECIGNGTITDIEPVTSGYKNKYDLVARWGRKYKIIEFKSRLKNIVKDFNDAVKLFNEMDCIVCWDVSEDDKQELAAKLSVDVEELHTNPLAPEHSQTFPNATHKLTLSGFTAPIFVIDLKKLLDSRSQS